MIMVSFSGHSDTSFTAVEKAFSITVKNLEVALEQAWGNCQLLELGKLDKVPVKQQVKLKSWTFIHQLSL